jgi:hypothetical protein
MSEYQSNSNRMKDEQKQDLPQKRAEKVITGTATQRKKNGLDILGSIFIANDVKDVKNYILQDVLIPTIKRAFFDIICNGTGMLLGERNPQRGGGPANKVSYRTYSDNLDDRRPTASTNNGSRAKSNYSYNDLVFNNRGDAEVVLERMYELLNHFDAVSVADLFDLAGRAATTLTTNTAGQTRRRTRTERS